MPDQFCAPHAHILAYALHPCGCVPHCLAHATELWQGSTSAGPAASLQPEPGHSLTCCSSAITHSVVAGASNISLQDCPGAKWEQSPGTRLPGVCSRGRKRAGKKGLAVCACPGRGACSSETRARLSRRGLHQRACGCLCEALTAKECMEEQRRPSVSAFGPQDAHELRHCGRVRTWCAGRPALGEVEGGRGGGITWPHNRTAMVANSAACTS